MISQSSILTETKTAIARVRAALKERGVSVAPVDGPSDDPLLRSLQEWQTVANALETPAIRPIPPVTPGSK